MRYVQLTAPRPHETRPFFFFVSLGYLSLDLGMNAESLCKSLGAWGWGWGFNSMVHEILIIEAGWM